MSLPSICAQSVKVYRAPLVSSRGSSVRDWGSAESWVIEGCSVQPTESIEGTDISDRENAQTVMQVYLPPDADVEKGDRVEYMGRTYIVDGIPVTWESATGALTHRYMRIRDFDG